MRPSVQLFRRRCKGIRAHFHERTWRAFCGTVVDGRATPADVGEDLGMSAGAVRVAKSRVLQPAAGGARRAPAGAPLDTEALPRRGHVPVASQPCSLAVTRARRDQVPQRGTPGARSANSSTMVP